MPIVVVTGATGKSGQYFVREIQKRQPEGFHFRFLVRRVTTSKTGQKGRELLKKIDGEIYEADIRKPDELEDLFATQNGEKVDTLLHIASVLWSPYIVPVALKHGVSRLILVHTTGIYSKYKKAGEAYRVMEKEINRQVEEFRNQGKNISVTYLRPTMVYGDLEDGNISVFMKMVYKLRVMPVINGAKYDLQPVWCGDLGKAYYNVLMNPEKTNGKEYILSGGAPIQLIEIFRIMSKKLGVKNTFVSCPFWLAYAGAWGIFLLSLGKVDLREKVQRMVEHRAYPHEDAKRDFGYSPVRFEDGINDEIAQFKAQLEARK